MGVDQSGGEFAGLVDAQGGVEEGFLGGGKGGPSFGAVGSVLAVVGWRRLRGWGSGCGGIVATGDLEGMVGEGGEEEVEDWSLRVWD